MLYVSCYQDFFCRKEDFLRTVQIQNCLACRHFLERDFDRAIPYCEKGLAVAGNENGRQPAEMGIQMSRERRP